MTKAKTQRQEVEKEELTRDALELLRSPRIFAHYLDIVRRSGLVGEERNAAVLNIAGISRLLGRPLNVIVKGPSSSGKNFLVNRALLPFPRSSIREITSSSALAWNYASDDFRHRIVYLQERNEASGAVHPARLLISEGKLVRVVTVNEGGVRTTKRFVAKGPIASISTTTKNQLEVDDETRHVSIWVDESREQTKRIVLAHSLSAKLVTKHELKVWRTAHELIEARAAAQVALPTWFRRIADSVYDGDVRVRRYYPAFVSACMAVSLLRSFQKESGGRDEEED